MALNKEKLPSFTNRFLPAGIISVRYPLWLDA